MSRELCNVCHDLRFVDFSPGGEPHWPQIVIACPVCGVFSATVLRPKDFKNFHPDWTYGNPMIQTDEDYHSWWKPRALTRKESFDLTYEQMNTAQRKQYDELRVKYPDRAPKWVAAWIVGTVVGQEGPLP